MLTEIPNQTCRHCVGRPFAVHSGCRRAIEAKVLFPAGVLVHTALAFANHIHPLCQAPGPTRAKSRQECRAMRERTCLAWMAPRKGSSHGSMSTMPVPSSCWLGCGGCCACSVIELMLDQKQECS